jgi:hypothetical protein
MLNGLFASALVAWCFAQKSRRRVHALVTCSFGTFGAHRCPARLAPRTDVAGEVYSDAKDIITELIHQDMAEIVTPDLACYPPGGLLKYDTDYALGVPLIGTVHVKARKTVNGLLQ